MVERPAPKRASEPARRTQAPQGTRGTAVAARIEAPERPPVVQPKPAPSQADAPFVVIRKAAPEADANVNAPAPAAPQKQRPAAKASPPAPAKPSKADRKAEEDRRREAERLQKEQQKAADRAREEQRKQAELRKAEQKAEEERRRKEEAKEAKKRQRKHHRHSKRVDRRAAELDLRSGERVGLSIEGWSRFRRATLVVTNYRVALVTRMSRQVRWIPLEEVAGVHRRWRGAHSLVVVSPIEVLTLQKAKREMLASFEELLSSEVSEARRPGAVERHHGDITQEWAERSTEIWDSQIKRLRLWIRRHPAVTLGTLTVCVAAAFLLTSLFTSFFSPYR
jgi:hypothetical protein